MNHVWNKYGRGFAHPHPILLGVPPGKGGGVGLKITEIYLTSYIKKDI